MANNKTYQPGSIAPFSGEAETIGPRGGDTKHQVTVEKGKRFPPPAKKGEVYIKAYGAHNKRGKGK